MKYIKSIRIFLLVLIIIGLGLLVTQNMWVPKVVDFLMSKDKKVYVEEKEKIVVFSPKENEKFCLGDRVLIKWDVPTSTPTVSLSVHTPSMSAQIGDVRADSKQYEWEAGKIYSSITNKSVYLDPSTVYTIWVNSGDRNILSGQSGMFTIEVCG
ncbi:MAG: hypothetical protein QG589_35 [Patescibacteria group bacterium]|nr:hypothetical protein [Patescibacteria group bacterium]